MGDIDVNTANASLRYGTYIMHQRCYHKYGNKKPKQEEAGWLELGLIEFLTTFNLFMQVCLRVWGHKLFVKNVFLYEAFF